jgi:subtilisin family serine protease
MRSKWLNNSLGIILFLAIAIIGLAHDHLVMAAQNGSDKIESLLSDRFTTDSSVDFIVRFTAQTDLSAAYAMDWNARGEFVYNALRDTAAKSQANAKAILDAAGLKYQTFIGGNDLYVWSGSLTNANALAALPEVSFIRATRTYAIDPVEITKPLQNFAWAGDYLVNSALTTVGNSPNATIDWGITDTKADQFWSTFGVKGAGIKVANIDTGVQWNHPALINQFACPNDPTNPNCWYDPSFICGIGGACDNVGHGTHTMGTMVASDNVGLPYIAGMAPDATWIACKGCESGHCSSFALTACANWILAPGGNPDNRPDVVNNSWGDTPDGDPWYQTYVNNWRAAGIFPAFSAGNAGSTCNSMGDPGSYQESFASAAHASNRIIASFSSRGDSAFGHIPYTKPNISAPGVSICSTVPTNSWACGYSGTSMASPHLAGAVALLWACNPSMVGQIDQTFQLLQNSADAPPAGDCGAPQGQPGNYTYGYGYLNVLQAGLTACAGVDFGFIDGHVLDQFNNLVAGASVTAAHSTQGNQIQAITNSTGYYTMTLPVGTYNLTASIVNYTLQTMNGVGVITGQVTTQDFVLKHLNTWTQLTQPPGCPDWTLYDGEYYAGTGKVYFLGGRSGMSTDGSIYSYNSVANTCTNTGKVMPTPISNYTINLVNDGTNDLLCTFGGLDSSGMATLNVQCFDPNANNVSIVTTLPVDWTGYVPGAQVVVNNMVYIFGGFNNSVGMIARTDKYDPIHNTFTRLGDLNMARSFIMATSVDGIIYAFGGDTLVSSNLVAQTIAEKMNPTNGIWDDVGVLDLPMASGEGRAYGFDTGSPDGLLGKIIIAGGGQFPNDTNAVISYNVVSNTYNDSFPDLNITRRDQAGFYIPNDPGTIWVFGGRSGTDTPPYAPPEFSKIIQLEIYLPIINK